MDGDRSNLPPGSTDTPDLLRRVQKRQLLYDPRVNPKGFEDELPSPRITVAEHDHRMQGILQREMAHNPNLELKMSGGQSSQTTEANTNDSPTGDDMNFEILDDIDIFTDLFAGKYQYVSQTAADDESNPPGTGDLSNQTQQLSDMVDSDAGGVGVSAPRGNSQDSFSTTGASRNSDNAWCSGEDLTHRYNGFHEHGNHQLSPKRPARRYYSLSPLAQDFPLEFGPGSSSFDAQTTAGDHNIDHESKFLEANLSDGMHPSLLIIGNMFEKWCPGCGHRGHGGLDFPNCPTGRLIRYIKSKGTEEYATMHKADGILLYVNDRHHLIDGMTYLAFRLQGEECTEPTYRLKQTGAKLMRALFKVLKDPQPGEFILPADPAQEPERSTEEVAMHRLTTKFFNLIPSGPKKEPKPFEDWVNYTVATIAFDEDDRVAMKEFTEAYSWFQDAIELARLRGEEFNLQHSTLFSINVGLAQDIEKVEDNIHEESEADVLTTDKGTGQKDKKRVTKADAPDVAKTKYRRGIDTSIYEGIETEILGGRASVRCSTCIMRGHTLTATKTCPVGMLDRALNCASARTKVQWSGLKPKADKACQQLEGVIALLGKFPEEKARLQKRIAEYRELDPATGRPRYAPIKGYALKVARKEALKALEENPDPLANIPLLKYTSQQIKDYTFPDLPGLGVKPTFAAVDWESLWCPDFPRDMVVRSICQLENIGDRPDTHCMLCLHYGHDSRSKSCLVQIVRQIFLNPTAHGISKAREILDIQLRHAFYWQEIVPDDQKKDTTNIAEVFQLYLDHKKAHEDKQMGLLSGRNKRQKIHHITPEPSPENPYLLNNIHVGNSGWDGILNTPQSGSFPSDHSSSRQDRYIPRRVLFQPPTPQYVSSPPQQYTFPQTVNVPGPATRAAPPNSAMQTTQPSQGTLIDHTKLRGDQFARIFPYVVDDGNNYGGLVVNFSAMPVQLVLELMPCVATAAGAGAGAGTRV